MIELIKLDQADRSEDNIRLYQKNGYREFDRRAVMEIGYGLYKRMGFEEVSEKDGIVSMRMELYK